MPVSTSGALNAPPAHVKVHIRASSRLALGNFTELWDYRDLFSLLVWRDFVAKYKQTALGPIWFVLQPLLPTVVFTIIFGKVAGMSTDGMPGFLFFFCNQIFWGYFAANFTSVSTSLLANQNVFSKVYFPRLVVPLSSLASNAFSCLVQMALFVAFYVWFKLPGHGGEALQLNWGLLLLPLVVLLLAAQGLGFGLWMAALTAKYRDLQQISQVIIQMWMYGSAIIFPLSQIPEKYRVWVLLNPVTFVSEAARVCLLGTGTITWESGLTSVAITVLVLFTGLALFDRVARVFVDIA